VTLEVSYSTPVAPEKIPVLAAGSIRWIPVPMAVAKSKR